MTDSQINLNGTVNSIDQCDTTSIENLDQCHLYIFPKKKTECDDDHCMKVVDELPILNGEYIQFIGPSGQQNDEIFIITNYRIFLLMNQHKSFVNMPLMMIEFIEVKEIFFIYVYLKNAKTLRLTFSTNEKTNLWYQRLNAVVSRSFKLDELFTFMFYSWQTGEKSNDHPEMANSVPSLTFINDKTTASFNKSFLFNKHESIGNLIKKEFKRMEFSTKQWRLSDANKKFELCPSYPETVIVPKCITDEQLRKIANFRSSKRFPTVVWRSRVNGACIARSSQPNVGLLAWRLNEDELLIKAIATSCASPNLKGTDCLKNSTNESKIIDSISSSSLYDSLSNSTTTTTTTATAQHENQHQPYQYHPTDSISIQKTTTIPSMAVSTSATGINNLSVDCIASSADSNSSTSIINKLSSTNTLLPPSMTGKFFF
jgi:hypothetical protein